MPIDLDTLIDTEALGKVPAFTALGSLVAAPGFAPKAWQSGAPDSAYESSKMPVQDSEDLQRILKLPRRAQVLPHTPEADLLIRVMTRRYALTRTTPCACREISLKHTGNARECITTLNLAQSWALYEIAVADGLLGPIGVGHGKTILDILAPLAFKHCTTAMLLVPVGLVVQLIAEYELVGQHFRLPALVVWKKVKLAGDAAPRDYMEMNPPGWKPGEVPPTLHVYPYTLLSAKGSTVKLDELAPDTIISDEVHNLRHADTARTARVLRYFDTHGATRFAGWSGSITDASLSDYAHLSAMALKERSPVPINPDAVDDWSRALDPRASKTEDTSSPWATAAPPGMLLTLDDGRGGHISEVFHRRLVETLGVVATTTPAIDAELSIEEQTAPPIPS